MTVCPDLARAYIAQADKFDRLMALKDEHDAAWADRVGLLTAELTRLRTYAEQAVALAYQRAAAICDASREESEQRARVDDYDAAVWHETCAAEAESLRDAILVLAPAEALAEVARLREALQNIARQKLTTELETELDVENADFEGGYDQCILTARAALSAYEGEKG